MTLPSTHFTTARTTMLGAAVVLVLLQPTGTYAQDTTRVQTTTTSTSMSTSPSRNNDGMQSAFGVKGGANWSTLFVDEARDVNRRLGFSVGLFGRVAPGGTLGFQIEALYDQKGTTIVQNTGTTDQETTYKFDYIDVPLMVVIPLGQVLELHAGGYFGAMIVSERTTSGDLGNGSTDPGDGEFNAFDYGLVGGLGVNLGAVQIGARYNHGLMAIADDDISRQVLGDSKNACAQLYLALALGQRD